MSNSVAIAYFSGEPAAGRFFPTDFRNPDDRRQAVSAARERLPRPELIAVLREQALRFGSSAARTAQIERLAAGGAVTVVTGQQVGLFGGPLYSVYKALSAIAVARALEQETGTPAVPLFWLQTEDHDFAEIARADFPSSDGGIERVELPEEQPTRPNRCAVATRRLGDGVEAALDRASSLLAGCRFADEVRGQLAGHYRAERRIVDAFAGLFSELFAAEGLLIFDPRTPAVAALSCELHRRSIDEARTVSQRLEERGRALLEAGYAVQIPARPGCSLSFYHPDGPDGPRYRVRVDQAALGLSGDPRRLTRSELDAALDGEPLRFSTSALLRPLLQDTLFPTAAYVGGPGEVAYFAQLAPLYDWAGVPMPLIVPRGRFALVEPAVARTLDEWSLTLDDLARPDHELARQTLSSAGSELAPERLRARLVTPFVDELARLAEHAAPADRGLRKTIDKTTRHVEDLVEKLGRRLQQAAVQADERRTAKLERARTALFPGGAAQERVWCWPAAAARFGQQTLKAALVAAYVPFSVEVRAIRLGAGSPDTSPASGGQHPAEPAEHQGDED